VLDTARAGMTVIQPTIPVSYVRVVESYPGAESRPGVRVAARVLLVDPAQRVLLFQGFDPHVPDEPFWFTAGGGIEPGEKLLPAAVRELEEETGLRLPPEQFVGPVWLRHVQFRFESVEYDSDEWFFLATLTDAVEVDTAGFTDLEIRTVNGYRWWTMQDLHTTSETIYPLQLGELLPGLLGNRWDGGLSVIE
jgi:8-oxo-dGTP pyrophosphatase MutT (NUDIX family)